ncbi:uncharacterized protein SCHCODRAFT_02664040 [Schizophyllum commune H4-8]|uniref:Uncharacterized protein n=1 Tax=Schizophyllum commune (strain H4-8 / FGSC 9210) TaxID=578458 RepID=D8PZ25_SCHCM|nr:uncharacterized protein SCHCODRAFT_02664040 [Schizophyllum commune H4-8]KAI5896197.1 hypothetical protein SCHCODRAFT_02664040 [Schizophyllum commune H4-8]
MVSYGASELCRLRGCQQHISLVLGEILARAALGDCNPRRADTSCRSKSTISPSPCYSGLTGTLQCRLWPILSSCSVSLLGFRVICKSHCAHGWLPALRAEHNFLVLKGSIPSTKQRIITIRKSLKVHTSFPDIEKVSLKRIDTSSNFGGSYPALFLDGLKADRVDALIERLGLANVGATHIGGARTREISTG